MQKLFQNITNRKNQLIESKSEELYDWMQKNDNQIDEGVFGSILGGLAGITLGTTIMKTVCKTLGIKEGPLYNLLTSKIVCTAAGAAIGYKV